MLPSPDHSPVGLGRQLSAAAWDIGQLFLITPLAIAVHRYVLLGEVMDGYALRPSDRRFMRFFGFAVLLMALYSIPFTIADAILGVTGRGGLAQATIGLAQFVILIIGFIVAVRTVILFPAIAIDAPGAGWANAMRDTKGHFWRVFFIGVFTVLPLAFFPRSWLLLTTLKTTLLWSDALDAVIRAVIGAVIMVPAVCAGAAASTLVRS